jgi:hypothetical protein
VSTPGLGTAMELPSAAPPREPRARVETVRVASGTRSFFQVAVGLIPGLIFGARCSSAVLARSALLAAAALFLPCTSRRTPDYAESSAATICVAVAYPGS